MMIWKIRVDYHNAMAWLALMMLKRTDEKKRPTHDVLNGMWHYHMRKSAKILQNHLNRKMKGR